ncbi:MAG: helix-turn-helix domain-containing protein [Acidobacteriota bacterium]
MPRESPYRIRLTESEARELRRRVNKYTLPYFQVQRAQMILLAAQGLTNDEIAQHLHITRDMVSKWRKRFFEERLGGLEDRPRPGRPRAFPPRDRGSG